MHSRLPPLLLVLLVSAGCGREPSGFAQAAGSIQAGTPSDPELTGIAALPGCSAVLVRNDRLLTAGHCFEAPLDPAFGADGIASVETGLPAVTVDVVASDAAGRVIVIGRSQGHVFLAALLPDGALDPSFGVNGVQSIDLPPTYAHPKYEDAVVDALGRVIAVGAVYTTSFDNAVLTSRFLPDGRPDPSFGARGHVVGTSPLAQPRGARGLRPVRGTAVALDTLGRVVVAGRSVPYAQQPVYWYVQRLQPNGALDAAFGTNGSWLQTLNVLEPHILGLRVDASGRIWGVGVTKPQGYQSHALRLRPTGVLDPTFGGTGIVALTMPPRVDVVPIDLVLVDGGFVFAANGYGVNARVVGKLRADGTYDPAFGDNGLRFVEVEEAWMSFVSLSRDPQGRYLLGAKTPSMDTAAAVRLTPSGDLDPSFDIDGQWRSSPPASVWPEDAVHTNGGLVLVGRGPFAGPGTPTAIAAVKLPDEHLVVPVPASTTVTLGSQSTIASLVHHHPSVDVAVVELTSPLAMHASTSGHVWRLDDTPAEAGQSLYCLGYGGPTGALTAAWMTIDAVEAHRYRLAQNDQAQIQVGGDSGGPCLRLTAEGSVIRGIAERTAFGTWGPFVIPGWHEQVDASAFAPWFDALP